MRDCFSLRGMLLRVSYGRNMVSSMEKQEVDIDDEVKVNLC